MDTSDLDKPSRCSTPGTALLNMVLQPRHVQAMYPGLADDVRAALAKGREAKWEGGKLLHIAPIYRPMVSFPGLFLSPRAELSGSKARGWPRVKAKAKAAPAAFIPVGKHHPDSEPESEADKKGVVETPKKVAKRSVPSDKADTAPRPKAKFVCTCARCKQCKQCKLGICRGACSRCSGCKRCKNA